MDSLKVGYHKKLCGGKTYKISTGILSFGRIILVAGAQELFDNFFSFMKSKKYFKRKFRVRNESVILQEKL